MAAKAGPEHGRLFEVDYSRLWPWLDGRVHDGGVQVLHEQRHRHQPRHEPLGLGEGVRFGTVHPLLITRQTGQASGSAS